MLITVRHNVMLLCVGAVLVLTRPCLAAPDPIVSAVKTSDALLLHLQTGTLRLQVWSPSVIRETFIVGSDFPASNGLAVIGSPMPTSWHVLRAKSYIAVVTTDVEARVERASGAVSYWTAAGSPLLSETPNGGRSLNPVVLPGPTPVNAYTSEDDFVNNDDEDYYGLGEHQNAQGAGESDHLGYGKSSVVLEQDYKTNLDIPLMVSSKGYGMFWNNPASTTFGFETKCDDIPASQLTAADGTPGGLTGQYYTGKNFDTLVKTQVDPTIDFDWSANPPQGLPHDAYSVRWTGAVHVKQTGSYTFTTTSDDGVRLFIDGVKVIDDWSVHAATEDSATVNLAANSTHDIKLEYFQDHVSAIVKLAWSRSATDLEWKSEAAESLDYFFVYGPSIDHVIAGYRTVTGQVPLPPQWALGYWQSKEHYATQEEWLDIASTYRSKQEPIDNIVQDWYYWDPYPWGSHVMDTARYPDPAAAIKQLHDTYHMHIMISVWGKFSPGNAKGPDPNYDALNAAGFLYPDSVRGPDRFYDAFNPSARSMYWGFMRDQLFSKGFDAWWLDASEPEANLSALRLIDTGAGRGALVLNAWPLEHTTAVFEGQKSAAPNQRAFILTRSAYAGEQRNAVTVWSSDITSGWDVYAHQICNALNMSLSSMPYWSSDTGGFFCNFPGGSSNPQYGELFTRWFQFSSFCSIFRVHGTNTPKELWRFGPTYEPILVKYDNLRYRLMPYIYSEAWRVTHDSGTIMRALVFDFPQDKTARELPDEYLFGPSLLVAPVVQSDAVNRNVYLPESAKWYDFWTGQELDGGQTISAPAPIDTLPLYVRAGSILPMGPFEQYASEKPGAPIEIRVYEGANAQFTLYEDDGASLNYTRGRYATIPFSWNQADRTLTVGARVGTYTGVIAKRQFKIVFVKPGIGAGLGVTTTSTTVYYSGRPITLKQPML